MPNKHDKLNLRRLQKDNTALKRKNCRKSFALQPKASKNCESFA